MGSRTYSFFSVPLFLSLLSLLFSLNTHPCIAADSISLGQSVSGNQTLVSSGGLFELGFFSPGSTGNYYIGVWYKTIPIQTIIWVANREAPISNPFSAHLKISQDGHLVLVNNNSMFNPIWSSSVGTNTSAAALAVLLDTGNLILRNGSASSAPVWQSFDHPTDTWMPGGSLGANKVTGEYQSLTAWKSSEDPASGPYSQSMDPDGSNQYVNMWKRSLIYWSSGLWNGQYFSALPGTTESTQFNFTFVDGKERKYATYTITDPSVITHSVLGSSGQTKQLLWQSSSQQWLPVYLEPLNSCDVYSFCGDFGICNQNASTPCQCLDGFEPANKREWDASDWSSGCLRKSKLQCSKNGSIGGGGEGGDGFRMVPNVRLPENSTSIMAARSSKECATACLKNCSCVAYSYDNGCSIWIGELRDLRQLYNGNSDAATLSLRLAASDLSSPSSSHKWVIAVVVSAVAGVIIAVTCVILGLKLAQKRKRSRIGKRVEGSLISFSYADLRHVTKNFSEKLGSGGFGSVFKGTLPDSTAIAVKKLEGFSQGEKQFRAEVSTLGAIQHVNLVRLRGFCCERSKRLLVYDYMSGGSLDALLLKKSSAVLDWKTRYQIMLGIARGIAYLHEECRECIVHCDIKPENILLDAEFCPKVADFGMAKLIGRDFSRVLTTMRGTVGYLAPEWISGLPITPKVDVYSFGMMLFELISGQRNVQRSEEGSRGFFPFWAASQVIEGNVLSLLDERLTGDADVEELRRVSKVACWCIQDSEASRPSMRQVVQILEGVLEVNMPPVPASLQNMMEDETPTIMFSLSSNEKPDSFDTSQSSKEI